MNTNLITQVLSVMVMIAQLLSILILITLLLPNQFKIIFTFVRNHGLKFAFLAALISMTGSLYYSEIAGYEPCKMCWYQRILMYPQVLILGSAMLKKQLLKSAIFYGLALSILGIIFSGYHYLLQIGVAPSIGCSAVGYSSECAKVFVMNFGYITIPLMSLTGFVYIFLNLLIASKDSLTT